MQSGYYWVDDICNVFADPYEDGEQDHFWTPEEQDEISYRVAEKIVKENGRDYYDDPEEAVYEEQSDIIGLYAVPTDSKLYELLLEWYSSEAEMRAKVRNCVLDYDYMYYVTGCGYDTLSADLLGGKSDGIARQQFDDFVRERV